MRERIYLDESKYILMHEVNASMPSLAQVSVPLSWCSVSGVKFLLAALFRQTLETDLRIEREWRGSLQKNLEQEKGKTSRLQTEIQHLLEIKRVG